MGQLPIAGGRTLQVPSLLIRTAPQPAAEQETIVEPPRPMFPPNPMQQVNSIFSQTQQLVNQAQTSLLNLNNVMGGGPNQLYQGHQIRQRILVDT